MAEIEVNLLLWNVRGLKNSRSKVWRCKKLHAIRTFCKSQSDVSAFTETHLGADEVARTTSFLGDHDKAVFTEGATNRSGVGMVGWRPWTTLETLQTWGDRAIAVRLSCKGASANILLLYFPCSDQDQVKFINSTVIPALASRTFDLVLGDWNHIHDLYKDQTEHYKHKVKLASKLCLEVLSQHGFVDMWHIAGEGPGMTYFSPGSSAQRRLDRGYKGPPPNVTVKSVTVLLKMDPFDHAPVKYSLILHSSKTTGPGVWRADPKLFAEKLVQEDILNLWEKILAQGWTQVQNLEAIRIGTIQFLKKYPVQRSPAQIWSTLMSELQQAELAGSNKDTLDEIKQELQAQLLQQVEWAAAAFNVDKDLREGLPTKMLTALLKGRRATADIPAVMVGDKVINDQEGIQRAIEDRWQEVFRKQNLDRKVQYQYLQNWSPQEGLFVGFDSPFTEDELNSAIKSTNSLKAPCVEDPGNSFLKNLTMYCDTLLTVINDCWTRGAPMPASWREGIVVLLYKGSGNPADLSNRRPISLLQSYYKVYTSMINARLQPILDKLCHPDVQHGFIRGRKIADNILNVYEATLSSSKTTISNLEDQRQAFDSVDHDFIYLCYQRAGCSGSALAAIADIYSNRTAKFLVNGHLTKSIQLEQGVPQGCCLSPSTFALQIEPLLSGIMADKSIGGTKLPSGESVKIQAFADDTQTQSSGTHELEKQLHHFSEWSKASGVHINPKKTFALTKDDSFVPLQGIQVIKDGESVKYLGLERGNSGFKANAHKLVTQFEGNLQRWSGHRFCLGTKVAIIKTYALSKLWYHSQLQIFTNAQVEKLEKTARTFLKNRQAHTPLNIPRTERLILPLYQGGINMVDFGVKFQVRNALRAAHMMAGNQPWKRSWLTLINQRAVERNLPPQWFKWEEYNLFWANFPLMSESLKAYACITKAGYEVETHSSQQLYQALIARDGPILTDSQIKTQIQHGVEYKSIWPRWAELTSPHYVRWLVWRWLHRILPIQSALLLACACGRTEGHEHTFIDCVVHATPVVKQLQQLWRARTDTPLLWNFKSVLTLGPTTVRPEQELVAIGIWTIWVSRNQLVHDEHYPSDDAILATIARQYIRAANKAAARKTTELARSSELDLWSIKGFTLRNGRRLDFLPPEVP